MNFSVRIDEYSESEAVMPTAEGMHFNKRKMSDTLRSFGEINHGCVKNCF